MALEWVPLHLAWLQNSSYNTEKRHILDDFHTNIESLLLPVCGWYLPVLRPQPHRHPDYPNRIQPATPEFTLSSKNRKTTPQTTWTFPSKTHPPQKLITSIYRKPTFTHSIIPYTCKHPTQHKYAVVKFLYNRLNSYGLQEQEYKQELNVIHNILHNNSFPITPRKHIPNNTARQQLT